MFEPFAVGTFWFWALVAIETILLFVFVNFEKTIAATLSIVLCLLGLQFFGDIDIDGYIISHPKMLILIAAGYLAAGVIWSVIRWYLFCVDRVRQYKELKDEFLARKNLPGNVVPPELHHEWLDWLCKRSDDRVWETPRVREHKARIINWMTFWVISVIWFFIHDFVTRIFKEIYYFIANYLQNMADKIFASVREDLKGPRTGSDHKDVSS